MRWLVFSHQCQPGYITGAETSLLTLISLLHGNPHSAPCEVQLVVPGDGQLAELAVTSGQISKLHRLELPLAPWLFTGYEPSWNTLSSSQALWPLIALLERVRPDAVLVNTVVHPLPAMAARMCGVPVVWAIHEVMKNGRGHADAVRFVTNHADVVMGASNIVIAGLRGAHVLHPTVRDDMTKMTSPEVASRRELMRRRWTIPDGEDFIVIGFSAAAIYEAKGLLHFLLMAEEIIASHPHVRFVVCGKPTDVGYMKICETFVSQRSSLRHRIIWHGFEREVASFYSAIDIYVMPSLIAEGFGLSALEAMVVGRAVVAYRSGGLQELESISGGAVLGVETGNWRGLAAHVRTLIDGKEVKARGAFNAARSRERFGVAQAQQRWNEICALVPKRKAGALQAVQGRKQMYMYQRGHLVPVNRAMHGVSVRRWTEEQISWMKM